MNNTILILDDDISVISSLEVFLSTLGFDVVCVEDAISACSLLKVDMGSSLQRRLESSLESIVVDYSFEGVDVNRLLASLRKRYPHAKVIVSSGYPRKEVLENVPSELVDSFLPKPFKPIKLAKELGFSEGKVYEH